MLPELFDRPVRLLPDFRSEPLALRELSWMDMLAAEPAEGKGKRLGWSTSQTLCAKLATILIYVYVRLYILKNNL